MSQSYRKLHCKITCLGEKRGEHDDKKRSSRNIRRSNHSKMGRLGVEADDDASANIQFKTRKSVQRWTFRGEGKTMVDPAHPGNFHVKKLGNKKVMMIK